MNHSHDIAKVCCAEFYQQAVVKFFLGDSFHPGGLKLTRKLAERLGVSASSNVLDVACGEGTSVLFLAEILGCRITGTDAGEKAILAARSKIESSPRSQVTFLTADSNSLPFPSESFDFVITECAFSTFLNKEETAAEIHRVLKPGGQWGLSDMVVEQSRLPQSMKSILFQAGCIGKALNLQGYADQMQKAGFQIIEREDTTRALEGMLQDVEKRLHAATLLTSISNLPVTVEDLKVVSELLEQGKKLVQEKIIGYGILIGKK